MSAARDTVAIEDAQQGQHVAGVPAGVPPQAALRVLELQRTAGNAAVTRMLQRCHRDPEAAARAALRNTDNSQVPPGAAEDADITSFLREALERYNITVTTQRGSMTLRVPYWSSGGRYARATRAAVAENPEVDRVLRRAGFRRTGTRPPEELQAATQAAINADLVSPLTEEGIRRFMERYGIGIDCTGFVTRALQHTLRQQAPGAAGEAAADDLIGTWRGVVPTPAAMVRRMPRIASPEELRPGDIQYITSPAHVRIITTVRTVAAEAETPALPGSGNWVVIEMAESSGSFGGPLERRFAIPAGDFSGIHYLQGDRWRRSPANNRTARYHRPTQLRGGAAAQQQQPAMAGAGR